MSQKVSRGCPRAISAPSPTTAGPAGHPWPRPDSRALRHARAARGTRQPGRVSCRTCPQMHGWPLGALCCDVISGPGRDLICTAQRTQGTRCQRPPPQTSARTALLPPWVRDQPTESSCVTPTVPAAGDMRPPDAKLVPAGSAPQQATKALLGHERGYLTATGPSIRLGWSVCT